MIAIEVEWKRQDKLVELSRRLSIPLQALSQRLAQRIKTRVQREGKDAKNAEFSPLGSYNMGGRSADPTWKWWVEPGKRQPGGWLYRIESGEHAGTAVYENLQHYISLLPAYLQKRRFDDTGEMWRAFKGRIISKSRVKWTFYGTRKTSTNARGRIANAQVAYLAGMRERYMVLQYSAEEKRLFTQEAMELLESSMGSVLVASAQSGRASSRTADMALLRRPSVRRR